MSAHIVGYARVSTSEQDLTVQQNQLAALGVPADLVYTDHGLTGANRDRSGLRQALVAVRDGDALVITQLVRLARAREGMQVARGRLRGKQPKLSKSQEAHVVSLRNAGKHDAGPLGRGGRVPRAAFEAEHRPGAVWAAVSPGDIINSVLTDALCMHLDLFQRLHVRPTSVSIVHYGTGRPTVLATNTDAGDLSWRAASPTTPRWGRWRRSRGLLAG